MMSVRVVNAGDGYAYLLDSVAAHDDTSSAGTSLSDYYQATGTPPGRWFGRGINGLSTTTIGAGVVVGEAQMAALYGEGLHPDADHKMLNEGATIKDVQLGRRFPIYTQGVPVLGPSNRPRESFSASISAGPPRKNATSSAWTSPVPTTRPTTA